MQSAFVKEETMNDITLYRAQARRAEASWVPFDRAEWDIWQRTEESHHPPTESRLAGSHLESLRNLCSGHSYK